MSIYETKTNDYLRAKLTAAEAERDRLKAEAERLKGELAEVRKAISVHQMIANQAVIGAAEYVEEIDLLRSKLTAAMAVVSAARDYVKYRSEWPADDAVLEHFERPLAAFDATEKPHAD